MTPENLAKVDDYLNITSRLKRETLHFFDEASVIVTSGNRMFGSGYRGQPAIEVQRYASNRSNKLKISRQQFSYFGNDVLSYLFKRFA